MTDREKLIELIDEAIVEQTVCSSDGHPVTSYMRRVVDKYDVDILADHLIANGVTFATDNNVGGKWIPVSERLPKDEVEVLIATDCGGPTVGIYDSKRKDLSVVGLPRLPRSSKGRGRHDGAFQGGPHRHRAEQGR